MKSHHVFTNFFVFPHFPEERTARPSGSGGCLAPKVSCFLQSKVCFAGRFRPFRGGQGLCRIAEEGRYSGHRGEATKRCVATRLAKEHRNLWSGFVSLELLEMNDASNANGITNISYNTIQHFSIVISNCCRHLPSALYKIPMPWGWAQRGGDGTLYPRCCCTCRSDPGPGALGWFWSAEGQLWFSREFRYLDRA